MAVDTERLIQHCAAVGALLPIISWATFELTFYMIVISGMIRLEAYTVSTVIRP